MRRGILGLAIFIVIYTLSAASAGGYSYDKHTAVVGTLKTYAIENSNVSLIELARKFDIGYNEIVDANPGLDPFVPGTGKSVIIPSSWILPDSKAYGIVINLSELRLYYYYGNRDETHVITFPIGIGDEGTDTPLGSFSVLEKIINPAWHVPASIRKEKPELPRVVAPGPNNPLGSHALRLSAPGILIHGTNRPYAIGRRASHGCIRLYPEDIPKLFKLAPRGTPVTIVRQPVKVGVKERKIFIEVHRDADVREEAFLRIATGLLADRHLLGLISSVKLLRALSEERGFPVEISQDATEKGSATGDIITDNPCGGI